MTEEERDERRRRRAALLFLPLLLLGAAFCFWTLFASVTLGEAESFIPAPLGSGALANYGEDEITGRLRSLSISIVEAVIRDRDPEEQDAGARATNVSESLKSPVPTVTPKPGDPTGTPTIPPTTTVTPNLSVTGTMTATVSPSPSPFPSRTPTPTKTDVPSSSPGPTATLKPCGPVITIVAPLDLARYTLADELPGQAIAYDPDCSSGTPAPDGTGIIKVEFEIKSEASGWSVVHYEDQLSVKYCAFDGSSICNTHSLSTGEWPTPVSSPPSTPEPIELGEHKLYARAQDDEGIWSAWVHVHFFIDPIPTSTPTPTLTPSPTATNTPTPTPTLTPSPVPPTSTPTPTSTDTPMPTNTPTQTPTPTPVCSMITIDNLNVPAGNEVTWDLTSGNATSVTITRVQVTWPTPNDDLNSIKVNSSTIWSGSDDSPGADLLMSGTVPSGGPYVFKFNFASSAVPSPYTLTVTFNAVCDVTYP
ncbi:MAG: hypothetical protein ACC647_04135 [Anaerolineales bacterium]